MRIRTLRSSCRIVAVGIFTLSIGCGEDDAESGADAGTDAGTDTDTDTDTDADADAGADAGPDTSSPWSEAVDSFWGAAPDEEERLAAFDSMWQGLSDKQATFATNDLDWDEIRETYRPLAAEATSMGRLYAVLSEVVHLLEDGHTQISSPRFCDFSGEHLSQRPPVFLKYGIFSALGACVAVMPDESLVVYEAAADNPAQLAPGDVIVGYDGHPWAENLAAIEAAHLPICGRSFPLESSNESASLKTAVNNAHLFETLNVVRAETHEAEAISTAELLSYSSDTLCSDQLPVAGIARPWNAWSEVGSTTPAVTYGIATGTNVGYIYAYDFNSSASATLFSEAVTALWETDGLVIDLRFNIGGSSLNSFDALEQLFNEDLAGVYVMYKRDASSEDRRAMVPSPGVSYDLDADESTFYDKPIALLAGPSTVSAGEGVTYLLDHHPRVRRFGNETSGSMGSVDYLWSPSAPHLTDVVATYCSGILADENGDWLHGAEQSVDEEVALTAEDILQSEDTVAKAAFAWIEAESAAAP